MLSRIWLILPALCVLSAWLRADMQAVPIFVAVVSESGNADDGWRQGLRSGFGPQIEIRDYRGEGAWARALASKPALALLQTPDTDGAALRRKAAAAMINGTIPVLVIGEKGAAELRRLATAEKILAIEVGESETHQKSRRHVGVDAARQLARLQTHLQPYLRSPANRDIEVVVSPDGQGDFKTVQYAIDHSPPVAAGQRLIIHLRPGVYRERVIVPRDRPRVSLRGADAKSTVITSRMSAANAGGTFLSATVRVAADEFEAENITFENSYGVGSQAVALHLESDRAALRNCRFLGWQDTLYAASGRQYFRDCYIEGYVDFIFGNAAAAFEKCEIHSLDSGYIAAHSRTQADSPTGFVFDHCRLTAKDASVRVFLGRPWRLYSRVVFLHCWMAAHIVPEGWDNWGSSLNEKTAVFAEIDCQGPGARSVARVPWTRHATAQEAAGFEPKTYLRGDDGWDPEGSAHEEVREW
jgi:pectinesterase